LCGGIDFGWFRYRNQFVIDITWLHHNFKGLLNPYNLLLTQKIQVFLWSDIRFRHNDELLYIGFKLRIQVTLKSCHDFGHRDTIGLVGSMVFWDGKSWHDLGNRDTIQHLPHQVSLKGTGHNGCSETIAARLDKIVTRFWTAVTSI